MPRKSSTKPNHRAILKNDGPALAPATEPAANLVRVRFRQRALIGADLFEAGEIAELPAFRAAGLGNLVEVLA